MPAAWTKIAWPSLRALGGWKVNLVSRIAQLNEWVSAPMDVPKCTWLGGLVNPQSFLTAVRQQTAQRNQQELDRLTIATDVTKRMGEEIDSASKDGAYITGLFMQGARFDVQAGIVDKCRPREMFCEMPVINIRSIPVDKLDLKGCYECPVYKTSQRGPTCVLSPLCARPPARSHRPPPPYPLFSCPQQLRLQRCKYFSTVLTRALLVKTHSYHNLRPLSRPLTF